MSDDFPAHHHAQQSGPASWHNQTRQTGSGEDVSDVFRQSTSVLTSQYIHHKCPEQMVVFVLRPERQRRTDVADDFESRMKWPGFLCVMAVGLCVTERTFLFWTLILRTAVDSRKLKRLTRHSKTRSFLHSEGYKRPSCVVVFAPLLNLRGDDGTRCKICCFPGTVNVKIFHVTDICSKIMKDDFISLFHASIGQTADTDTF